MAKIKYKISQKISSEKNLIKSLIKERLTSDNLHSVKVSVRRGSLILSSDNPEQLSMAKESLRLKKML